MIKGKLKLKGSSSGQTKVEKKKKKKRKGNEKRDYEEFEESPAVAEKIDARTEAEKAYDARSREQRRRKISEQADLSHKDKVKLFNEKLSRLSEHHDLPKVGPG